MVFRKLVGAGVFAVVCGCQREPQEVTVTTRIEGTCAPTIQMFLQPKGHPDGQTRMIGAGPAPLPWENVSRVKAGTTVWVYTRETALPAGQCKDIRCSIKVDGTLVSAGGNIGGTTSCAATP